MNRPCRGAVKKAYLRRDVSSSSRLSNRSAREKLFVTTPTIKIKLNDEEHTLFEQVLEQAPTVEAVLPPDIRRDGSRLRSSKKLFPTCCDYGADRRWQYPGFYFCTSCDYWQTEVLLGSKRTRRESRKFRCKANHESWITPTDKVKVVIPTPKKTTGKRKLDDSNVGTRTNIKKKRKKKRYTSEEDNDDIAKQLEFAEMEEKYLSEINNLRKQIKIVVSKNEKLLENNSKFRNELKNSINNYMSSHESRFEGAKEVLVKENKELFRQLNLAIQSSTEMEASNKSLQEKVNHAERVINDLRNRISNQQRAFNIYKEKTKNNEQKTICFNSTKVEDLVDEFFRFVQELCKKKNRRMTIALNKISNKLFDPNVFEGILMQELIARCQDHYRENIFSPQNLLRLMDQHGGQLSMTAIDLLRTLDTNGEKYNRHSILPASSSIKRAATVVDAVAKHLVPFKEGIMSNGAEYCEFEVAPVVQMMLKSYGLEETSKKREVHINQAIDGAKLTTRLHHTTYGLKMADRAACDPRTGKLIYGSTDPTSLQSRNYCHPLKIILSKESGEVMNEFKGVMEQVKNLTNTENSEKLLNGAQPIKTFINADLSAQWKLIKKGYRVKSRKGYPCHVCATCDDDIHLFNAVKCSKWCNEIHHGDDNWKCYHQDFLDENSLEALRSELEEVKTGFASIIE